MSNKPWLFVLLGCGGLTLLAMLGCGGLIFYTAMNFKNFDKEVSPAVDKLFAAAASGEFGSTYEANTSLEFKQATSREQYDQLGATIEGRLGALKSKSLSKVFFSQQNASRFVDVNYNATFEKGSGTISARFQKDGERWLLVRLNVNSPALLGEVATEKCPHCGEAVAASAKFCSKCGKPIDAVAEPATDANSADAETKEDALPK
jgi:hypothetical protein